MKSKTLLLSAVLGLTSALALGQASDLIAYWNFNTTPFGDTVNADVGSGVLRLDTWGGNITDFTGTTINALPGVIAGRDLALQVGTSNAGNGTFIQFDFDFTNYRDVHVTFAVQGTSSGFDTGTWSASTNNSNFVVFGNNTATQSGTRTTQTSGSTDILNNASTAHLRYTLDGADGTTSNNRLDNIQIRGTYIHQASAGSITQLDTEYRENFNAFRGDGFSATPSSGQLNSNAWRVTGHSDEQGEFGGEHAGTTLPGLRFSRGVNAGSTTFSGVYAWDLGNEDYALGIKPTGNDLTPGEITYRFVNDTGETITALDITYEIMVLNNQGRSSSFNFAHSADDNVYISVSSLDFTSPEAADADPEWMSFFRSVTLSDLNIQDGEFYYLQWQTDDVGGSGARDSLGLNNFTITAIPEPGTLVLVGLTGIAALVTLRRKRA
jgi:hypothetical protein